MRLYGLVAHLWAAPYAAPAQARPQGQLVCICMTQTDSPAGIAHLARRMQRDRPALRFLLTGAAAGGCDLAAFPAETLLEPAPLEQHGPLRKYLDHWRPDLVLLSGQALPPLLVQACADRAIPTVLIEARKPAQGPHGWSFARALNAGLLPLLTRVLAQDAEAADYFRQIAHLGASIEITGRVEETTDPLPCIEAERDDLSGLLRSRPVWLAMSCPAAEEEAVIAAHAHALRLAHRILLILIPTDPQRAAPLADRLVGLGWHVSCRARDEEPEPDCQVFIADGETELGLWYRLAPVSYMAGTLIEGGGGRSPLEPAALGSAIVHGPHVAPYPEAYARLAAAGAARRIMTPAGLSEAIADLMSPDKAALLAHNAWAAASGGAEVTERVMEILFDAIDHVPRMLPSLQGRGS